MDFPPIGLATFRIIKGAILPRVAVLLGETIPYLQPNQGTVSQCLIRIFPVQYRCANLSIFVIDIVRRFQPYNFPANFFFTLENLYFRLILLGSPCSQ